MEIVVDDGASAAAALDVVGDDGASVAAVLDFVGDDVSADLDVVGDDGVSAGLDVVGDDGVSAGLDVVGDDGASGTAVLDVVGDDGASDAAVFDVFRDDGASAPAALDQKTLQHADTFQYYLDKTTPYVLYRWIGTAGFVLLYALRIYFVQGFYFVTYLLGLYILNLLVRFLSPLVDPEMEPSDGPLLPINGSDEFKPFIRRLPEFKFWYSITKAFCMVFIITFFSIFDVPLYWPVMLMYWLFHFIDTMGFQISRMIKYKYIPFNLGKLKVLRRSSRD